MLLSDYYTKADQQLRNAAMKDIYKMIHKYGLNNDEISWSENYVIIEHKEMFWLSKIDSECPVDMVAIEKGDYGQYEYKLHVGIDGVHYTLLDLDNILITLRAVEKYFGLDKQNTM